MIVEDLNCASRSVNIDSERPWQSYWHDQDREYSESDIINSSRSYKYFYDYQRPTMIVNFFRIVQTVRQSSRSLSVLPWISVISVRSFPFFICSLFIWMITVLNSFFYDVHNRPKWKSVLANDSSFFMNLQSERIPKRLTVSVNWMSIQGATNSTTHMMTHHNDQLLVIDQSEVIILKFRENSTFL